jgi:2C-methyl-D-erythritol 2,4-cyclodiphosphate synthase
VKATTSEGMSFVGTEDGAAAYATCLLRRDA